MRAGAKRRDFLRAGTVASAGLLATTLPAAAAPSQDYPRDHAGVGGPVGSATDRGKLVSGLRAAGQPPVLVETPDLPNNLPWKMVDGAKEFHLHAQPVKRELLPGDFMNHWGYNGAMPGPHRPGDRGGPSTNHLA